MNLINDADELMRLGMVAHARRTLHEAKQAYQQAMELFERAGEKVSAARALGNIAAVAHDVGAFEQARTMYLDAIRVFAEAADARLEGIFLCNLGILDREEADAATSLEHLHRARACLSSTGDLRLQATVEAELGSWHLEFASPHASLSFYQLAMKLYAQAEDGRGEAYGALRASVAHALCSNTQTDDHMLRAERGLERARAYFIEHAEPLGLALWPLAFAFVDLAGSRNLARREIDALARTLSDRASEASVVATRGTAALTAPLVAVSDDARTLVRLLRRELDATHGNGMAALRLHIVGDRQAYLSPSGEHVDLSSRATMRDFLGALVAAHTERAGPLTVEQLWNRTWPGERAGVDTMRNRVHVALHFFRSNGLRAVLLRQGQGYALDPKLEVRIDQK